jgi:homoserine kinase
VPASVANLGGGFDTLAVAVQLYLRLRIIETRDDGAGILTVVNSTPPVRGRNAVERAFEALARRTGIRAPSVFAEADSEIPMSAGLGSSAAAAVAGLRMFERVTQPLPDGVLLAAATTLEGHADNAAAALHGGLTSVVEREGLEPVVLRWQWPEELRLVVATPVLGLATSMARAALSPTVSRKDAVFNLQRVLALVHVLQSGEYGGLREAVGDRLHQPARAALVPQLSAVLALDDPDVLGAFLSGAGPSVAVLARRDCGRVEQLLTSLYERAGSPVVVRTLGVHQSADAVPHTFVAACPEPGRGAHGRTV